MSVNEVEGAMMRDSSTTVEFVAFTRAHRGDLLRSATLLAAGDAAHAEDLVQTTLTKLYLAWPRVRRADSPLAYARRSLAHVFIDEQRRAHRRRETAVADPHVAGDELGADDPDLDLRAVVLAALGSLGPRQRAVVVLRHWHDLDIAETAHLLGISPGTVKSQNARALQHLRSFLASTGHDLTIHIALETPR